MQLDDNLLEQLKANDPELTHLELTNLSLTASDIKSIFESLKNNTMVTSLDISNNVLGDEGVIELAKHPFKHLYVGNNEITFKGAVALAANSYLEVLHINYNETGKLGAKAFAKNITLRELVIDQNCLESEAIEALATNRSLQVLSLGTCQVDDAGAECLAKNTYLVKLCLSGNAITDKGAKALAANTNLYYLDLSYNEIKDEGAVALAKSANLTNLNLRVNKIGIIGAKALLKATHLTYLDIFYNNLESIWEAKLEFQIANNQQQLKRDRGQVVLAAIVLALHKYKGNRAAILQLPTDILCHIFNYINFPSSRLRYRGGKDCASYIFNTIAKVSDALNHLDEEEYIWLQERLNENVKQPSKFSFFSINQYRREKVITSETEDNLAFYNRHHKRPYIA